VKNQDKQQHQTPETKQQPSAVAEDKGEELEEQEAAELPDREAMSLINANVAAPINAAVAANVLSDGSVAYANAIQDADIDQSN